MRFGPPKPTFINTYSLDFDGVDDYISTGINTSTNDVSISCWIKTTETFAYTLGRCAFGGSDGTYGKNYTLGRLGSSFSTPNDTVVRIYNTLGTTKLNDGNWHHIVFTYGYTTKEIKAYTDGNLEVTLVSALFTSRTLVIGSNGGTFRFLGNVDECSYFTNILSASEITDIYNGGTPTDLTSLNPLAWYRMGEKATYDGTNWTLVDQGSGGNDATSVNMDLIDRVEDTP